MFSKEDKIEIRNLYNQRAIIRNQYDVFEKLKNEFQKFKEEYKKLFESKVKIETSQKLLKKRMEAEMFESKARLTSMVKTWNDDMEFHFQKYNYEKLNDFLLIQPIYRKIGLNRVTPEFARETKKEAKSQEIVFLQGDMRYGYGSVQTTNYYPVRWLTDNYYKIYERTDKKVWG